MHGAALILGVMLSVVPDSTAILDAVQVKGRRPAQPAPVFTLTREWLAAKHPVDMQDALLSVSGLRMMEMGAHEAMPAIRGMGANRVAVLLDGRPLNTAQGGGVDLNTLDPDSLERIEIARGSVGAVYGPHALGGAVNLVRRRDAEGVQSLRLLGGEEAMRARGFLSGGRGPWEWHTGAEGQQFQEQGRTSWTRSAWMNAGRHAASGALLAGDLSWYDDSRAVPGSRGFPTPRAVREDQRFLAAGRVTGLPLSEDVFWDHDVSVQRQVRAYSDPGAPLGPIQDRHTNHSFRWYQNLELNPQNSWGMELVHHRLRSTTDGRRTRWQGALSTRWHTETGGWRWSSVGRADWLEGMHPRGTLRVQGERTVGTHLHVHAGAGTSFRAPTFDDLFWPARASAAGNPNLKPERGMDVNLGAAYRSRTLQVEVNSYTMTVRDWIAWEPGVDGIWRPHNARQVNLGGVETSAVMRPPAPLPTLDLAYTWSLSRDAGGNPLTQGKQLVGRPQHRLVLEGRWNLGPGILGGGLQETSETPLTAANTKWQPRYTVFHAFMRFNVSPTLLVEVEGRNLTNTHYEDVRGFAARDRQVLLGLSWRTPAP